MFPQKLDVGDQKSLVLKKLKKRKIENQTDYLQNVMQEINVCESSDTTNFVCFAKKNSLIKIEDKIEKALNAVFCKGICLTVCL